jgi:hypothetical protein
MRDRASKPILVRTAFVRTGRDATTLMFAVMQVLAVCSIIYYSSVLDDPKENNSKRRVVVNHLLKHSSGIRNSTILISKNRTERKWKTLVIFLHIHKCFH